MEYADSKVISLRNWAKKTNNIEQGVYINEEQLTFQRRELFDGAMSVLLPVTFQTMPEEAAKMKYPSEQRPQLIYSNTDGDVNYTFSLLDLPVNQKQITQVRDGFKNIIKKVQPANIFYKEKEEPLGDTKVAWFDFKNYGLDAQLYNLFYFTDVNGKLLHGIFNCKFEDSEVWKPVAEQVIKSILIENHK